MIRVYYRHPHPDGGYYSCEHSMPVADMKQFTLRQSRPRREGYNLAGVLVTRIEPIDTSYENGAAAYYERYGTVGEF